MKDLKKNGEDWIRFGSGSDRVMVKLGKKYHLIQKNDICYIESEGNYARIYCGEKSFLVKRTLLFLEEKLGPRQFVRINRSVLVNIDAITEMEESADSDYQVKLENKKSFSWSRRYRERLTRAMKI